MSFLLLKQNKLVQLSRPKTSGIFLGSSTPKRGVTYPGQVESRNQTSRAFNFRTASTVTLPKSGLE